MKLRTKLVLTTALIFLMVFAVCIGGLLSANVQNTKQLLRDNAATERGLIEAHFLRQMSGGDELPRGLAERSRAEYVFRRISLSLPTDAWYVLLLEDEVLRNDSGVTVTPAVQAASGIISLDGRQYCISKAPCACNTSAYTIAVIRDVTGQMEDIYRRTVISAVFAIGLLLIGLVGLFLLIRRALRPIQDLEAGAKAISEGDYDKRIGVRRRDELGALSESFDRMADAVQTHVEQIERKEQEQRMLLRAVSHETRTPVTAISGFAWALNNASLSEAERQEAARYIQKSSRQLKRAAGFSRI